MILLVLTSFNVSNFSRVINPFSSLILGVYFKYLIALPLKWKTYPSWPAPILGKSNILGIVNILDGSLIIPTLI